MNLIGWLKKVLGFKNLPFNIEEVEQAMGYHFKNPIHLFRSLKHRSYSLSVDGTKQDSNERLEFLGDAVLNMITSDYVYTHHPEFQEGDLTKLKSSFVNKRATMIAGRKIGLNRYILLKESEEHAGVRNRTSVIADAYEAMIGAIFLDGGFDEARAFVYRTILDDPDTYLENGEDNFKSCLLEFTQARRWGHPIYNTVAENGPDHEKMFTVEVSLNNTVIGTGSGKTKKEAQQVAAKAGIEQLQSDALQAQQATA